MRDFFLSHAAEDKEDFVLPLASALKSQGMSVWVDKHDIAWVDDLFECLNDGLKDSRFVIAFMSENFIQKNWPKRELYAALDIEDKTGKKKVLLLMLCEPEVILREYPLLANRIYIPWKEGIPMIMTRCKQLANGKLNVVSNAAYPDEERDVMRRKGYQKTESIVYKYEGKLDGNSVSVKSDLAPGTDILVEVAEIDREDLAVEFGARSAVIQTFAEKAPDKLDKLMENPDAMKALTDFAAAMGGRPIVKKFRKRIPTTVGKNGVITLRNLPDVIDEGNVDLFVTVIDDNSLESQDRKPWWKVW